MLAARHVAAKNIRNVELPDPKADGRFDSIGLVFRQRRTGKIVQAKSELIVLRVSPVRLIGIRERCIISFPLARRLANAPWQGRARHAQCPAGSLASITFGGLLGRNNLSGGRRGGASGKSDARCKQRRCECCTHMDPVSECGGASIASRYVSRNAIGIWAPLTIVSRD